MASKDDNFTMSLRDAVARSFDGESIGQEGFLTELLAGLGIDVVIPEQYAYMETESGYNPRPAPTAAEKAYRDQALEKIDSELQLTGGAAQNAAGEQIYQQSVLGADGSVLSSVDSAWEDPGNFEKAMPYLMAAVLGAGFVAAAGGAGAAGAGAAGSSAGAGTAGVAGAGGAFTLPVSAGAVGPVGSAGWSSLGATAVGGGAAAGGAGLAAGGGSGLGGSAAVAGNGLTASPGVWGAGTGAAGSAGALGSAGAAAAGSTGLFGTGITAGQVASGLGVAGQLYSGIKGFGDAKDLTNAGKAADPFAPYRAGYAEMLQRLMQDPSSVTTLPGYQFGLDESNRVLTQNLASQGLTGSGTAAKAITHNATDYAGKFYQQQLQTLAGLGGANINNAGLSLQAQSAGSSLENQSINNLAKLIPTVAGWFGS